MPVDVVCGMEISEDEAVDKVAYRGRYYYFCSTGCKEAFEEDPEKYADFSDTGEIEKTVIEDKIEPELTETH